MGAILVEEVSMKITSKYSKWNVYLLLETFANGDHCGIEYFAESLLWNMNSTFGLGLRR